ISDGGLRFAVRINNSDGGLIGGNAAINVDIAGSLVTQGDARFHIFNENDFFGSPGRSIRSDSSIGLNVGGELSTAPGKALDISTINNDGGTIGGDASISASIRGNLSTTDLNVGIQDYNGGRISGGGNVTLNIGGDLTVAESAHPLFLFFNTFNGGSINNG